MAAGRDDAGIRARAGAECLFRESFLIAHAEIAAVDTSEWGIVAELRARDMLGFTVDPGAVWRVSAAWQVLENKHLPDDAANPAARRF